VKWQTDCDRFEPGQWFKGHVYERRSDLSPDGSLLIYFASKINRRTLPDREYTYAWTAISRPPYFTALALWPKGNCWHGGGLFLRPRHIWLNHKPEVAVPHPKHRPKGLRVTLNPEACGEDAPTWSRRMERDGWTLIQTGAFVWRRNRWRTERPEIWEHKHPAGSSLLIRSTDAISFTHPGGPYLESFRLVLKSGEEMSLPAASWADWDQAGRLVLARDGALYAATSVSGRIVERQLIDLNANAPTQVEAPEFARHW
jgi:hypothetical protein